MPINVTNILYCWSNNLERTADPTIWNELLTDDPRGCSHVDVSSPDKNTVIVLYIELLTDFIRDKPYLKKSLLHKHKFMLLYCLVV